MQPDRTNRAAGVRTPKRRRARLAIVSVAVLLLSAFALAASAGANAPNPNPDISATSSFNPDGTVTVSLKGTWVWPGQPCSGRWGEGWAVDWWGVSGSQTPANNFTLTNVSLIPSFGQRTSGSESAAGAIQIPNNGGFFHVGTMYNDETVNSASTCTTTGSGGSAVSSGSWSATATYPNNGDIPPSICVNGYDEHGSQGKPGGASDISPIHDGDNSIQTNKFNPSQGMGFCTTVTPPRPNVYLGYADTYPPRSPGTPTPWQGGASPLNPSLPLEFIGGTAVSQEAPTQPAATPSGEVGTGQAYWDGGAIRIDNPSNGVPLMFTGTGSSVTIGKCVYAPWGGTTETIAPGQTLILTQTINGSGDPCGPTLGVQALTTLTNGSVAMESNLMADSDVHNFDTSESNVQTILGQSLSTCAQTKNNLIPVINLVLNGATTTVNDTAQILNTGGLDMGGALCAGNEFTPWTAATITPPPAPPPVPSGYHAVGGTGAGTLYCPTGVNLGQAGPDGPAGGGGSFAGAGGEGGAGGCGSNGGPGGHGGNSGTTAAGVGGVGGAGGNGACPAKPWTGAWPGGVAPCNGSGGNGGHGGNGGNAQGAVPGGAGGAGGNGAPGHNGGNGGNGGNAANGVAGAPGTSGTDASTSANGVNGVNGANG